MTSEAELAAKVVAYLEADGWDVYQEVTTGDTRADIVAVREPIVIVVECKKSLSLDVMGQAYRWISSGLVNQAFVAVPLQKTGRYSAGAQFSVQVMKRFGIGLLRVANSYVSEYAAPAFHRRLKYDGRGIRKYLNPKQKVYAKAGSSRGGQWTPFKETCDELRKVVAASPGITMKEAVETIKHHYRTNTSARSSLTRAILNHILTGVRVESEGKQLRLYPDT